MFLEGMVVLDLSTETPTARNVSTFVVTNGSPRVGGKASYMPSYGEKGLVAFIGGGEKSTLDHSSDGLGSLVRVSKTEREIENSPEATAPNGPDPSI